MRNKIIRKNRSIIGPYRYHFYLCLHDYTHRYVSNYTLCTLYSYEVKNNQNIDILSAPREREYEKTSLFTGVY